MMQMSYWRFAAMIATSTVVMFGLMYLNTYAFEHILWSETRAWMALLMGAEAVDKPAEDDLSEEKLLRALMEAQGQQ